MKDYAGLERKRKLIIKRYVKKVVVLAGARSKVRPESRPLAKQRRLSNKSSCRANRGEQTILFYITVRYQFTATDTCGTYNVK